MRNILKFGYKELKLFYILEIFLFIVVSLIGMFYHGVIPVFNPLRVGFEYAFNPISDFTKLLLYINLIAGVVILQMQLTSSRGKLMFLTNISGKKFFLSHITGFILIQAFFGIMGVITMFLSSQVDTMIVYVRVVDTFNIFLLFLNTVAIYLIILFVTTFVRSRISNYVIASGLGVIGSLVGVLIFLFINYIYPHNFWPAGTMMFLINKMFYVTINIPIILIQCLLGVLVFFKISKVLENKLDIV
ncbi:hypothetical protein [Clostridium sp. 'White wine YQ']|uniref:hypothetical protein n=1 Tax=Clostridium sp. 'White wine YQ' TaxID=3027474 RepID=UPI0023660CC5|nr:hypothetical protein [Clostridium sp. 'White wine YQ']MDD7795201.1 hypothetical protein [Clostridium sp. 'White wine YQ']